MEKIIINIPDSATNKDVAQLIFPEISKTEKFHYIFPLEFWNAPYKDNKDRNNACLMFLLKEYALSKIITTTKRKSDNEVNFAMEITRKYEKIQEILKDILYGGCATIERIQEVIENGNDN